jgi:hypothetical protein
VGRLDAAPRRFRAKFVSMNRLSVSPPSCVAATLAAATVALLLAAPSARGQTNDVLWNRPTPTDGTLFSVSTGSNVSFQLVASSSSSVHIAALGPLPDGATVTATDGPVAQATFTWTPAQEGDYSVQFTAVSTGGGVAPTLTYAIHAISYPRAYPLSDDKVAHWAFVLKRAPVHTQPSSSSRVKTTLSTGTTDGTQNLVEVLDGVDVTSKQTWYHVRLPILPNNSLGWVRRGYLSGLQIVHTHLYVDRHSFTATLQKDGVPVFKAIVGVGKPYWPTPRGEFYIRDKLTNFGDPFYGPVAFGTSARSAVLTDWPGGGFVGVHGTNQPGILPGQVSHGCVRMRNPSIVQLSRLMPVGTPLTIA